MPALPLGCPDRRNVFARGCRRGRVLAACIVLGAAIAPLIAPLTAQPAPQLLEPSSAPAADGPATPPAPSTAAPPDKGTLPPGLREAITRAEKGDKEDLPKTRKDLLAFVTRYPENLEGLQLLARACELSPAPGEDPAGGTAQDFTSLADSIWLRAAAVAVRDVNGMEQYQEAMRICDQALRRGPGQWPANLEMARLYAKSLRGAQAVDHYNAYLKACREADPVRIDTQACLELARLHLNMNRWRLAVQVLTEARKDDAANPEIDATLARAYRVGADPANREAGQGLTESERTQLLSHAADAIDEALRKDPHSHQYLLAKVDIRRTRNLNNDQNKDLDEAINAASLAVRLTADALKKKPGDHNLLVQLSRSYEAFGATLVTRLQQNRDDAPALVRLMQLARRHVEVERETSLRQLLQQVDRLAAEQIRNDPAAKMVRDEIEKTLKAIQAGEPDLPVATRPEP